MLAGVLAAAPLTGRDLAEHTFMFAGDGAGGTAIAEVLAEAVARRSPRCAAHAREFNPKYNAGCYRDWDCNLRCRKSCTFCETLPCCSCYKELWHVLFKIPLSLAHFMTVRAWYRPWIDVVTSRLDSEHATAALLHALC